MSYQLQYEGNTWIGSRWEFMLVQFGLIDWHTIEIIVFFILIFTAGVLGEAKNLRFPLHCSANYDNS